MFTDNWDFNSHEMKRNQFGVFEIIVPAVNGEPAIPHDSKVKVWSMLLVRFHNDLTLIRSLSLFQMKRLEQIDFPPG